jgi:putative ABC transport system substrate-binding protein
LSLCSPLPALAQAAPKARVYRVGIFSIGSDPARPVAWDPFVDAMRRLGYVEGKNLVLVRAHGNGNFDLLEALMRELLSKRVDIIVVSGLREAHAAKRATATIPIVITQMPSNPVAEGLVASLTRPGGNVTGFMFLVPGIYQTYVELLTEAVPSAVRIATITSPPNPTAVVREELLSAAKSRRVQLTLAHVNDPAAIAATLARLKQDGVGGLIVPLDEFTVRYRHEFVDAVEKVRLPAIYATRSHVDAGGLMSYGTTVSDLVIRGADYVDRILRGTSPGNLPVQQPTRLKLVVNLKAAKAVGLVLPSTIMARADEVTGS